MKRFKLSLSLFPIFAIFAIFTVPSFAAGLPNGSVCFKSHSNEFIIYGNKFAEPLYIGTSNKLFEMKNQGFGGSMIEHDISFHDPHSDKNGEFTRNNNNIVLQSVNYIISSCPQSTNIVPLPTVRETEYLFSLSNGRLLYVSADKYNYSYESFRMYIGDVGKTMNEVDIVDVVRYKDGGTTRITTDYGILFSPFNEQPEWNNNPIQHLDEKQFVITENGSVTITLKR